MKERKIPRAVISQGCQLTKKTFGIECEISKTGPVKLRKVLQKAQSPDPEASAAGGLRTEAGPWRAQLSGLEASVSVIRWVKEMAFSAPCALSTGLEAGGQQQPLLSPGESPRN